MKCETARAQLTAYLDGELEDERGSAVRGHLRACDACRQVASDEAALRDGLRALPPLDPPARLWAGVQHRLAAAEVADAERPAWRRMLARWAPIAPQLGLAGCAIGAAVALIVLRVGRDDEPGQPPAMPTTAVVAVEPGHADLRPPPPVPIQTSGDVTAELAAEPARVTRDYAQAARELEELAHEARPRWGEDQKRQFDAQVVMLKQATDRANDERGRQRGYRSLIRYLQRAAIRDDVALAATGGAP